MSKHVPSLASPAAPGSIASEDHLASGSPPVDAPPVAALHGVVIVVCETCRQPGDPTAEPRPGAALCASAEAAASGSGFTVRRVSCLSNCKRGLSAAIVSDAAWTYVFGDLKPDSGPDLLRGAELLAGSVDGLMPFRPRPETLKRGMIARIPNMQTLLSSPAKDMS
ncbi:hypothetical protein GCM10019059_08980 [Camelimonas fluminis]|nr:DUF1636 family protein [Camelimonas fluminis]GHE51861.1 hypothetical protein GCM10019059_08980 [Camelimonas fluminis]